MTDRLHELLAQKLANPLSDTINGEFMSQTILHFTATPSAADCMWCKHPDVTGELLWLFSLNDNPHLEWLKAATTACLCACRACIESYYTSRTRVLGRYAEIYDDTAMRLFVGSIRQFDTRRLSLPLLALERDPSKCRSPGVIFALFEILLCPRWIKSPEVGGLFEQVLIRLIDARKMLKVSEALCGVVLCSFHLNPVLRSWAATTLLGALKPVDAVVDDEFSWEDILTCFHALSKLGTVAKSALLHSLALSTWWTPKQLILACRIDSWLHAIVEELKGGDSFADAFSIFFAVAKSTELARKYKGVVQKAMLEALSGPHLMAKLNSVLTGASPDDVLLPGQPISSVLLDWVPSVLELMPSLFNALCDRIKQTFGKYSAASLSLLHSLLKAHELSADEMDAASLLVASIPSANGSTVYDFGRVKRQIAHVLFSRALHLELTSELTAKSTKAAVFFRIFALLPVNQLAADKVEALARAWLDRVYSGAPDLASSLWLEREPLLSVIRSRLTDGSDFDVGLQVEFSLATLVLLNHFGELDAKQAQLLKKHAGRPEFCTALAKILCLLLQQSLLLKRIVEQADLWTQLLALLLKELKSSAALAKALGDVLAALIATTSLPKRARPIAADLGLLFFRVSAKTDVFLSTHLCGINRSLDDALAKVLAWTATNASSSVAFSKAFLLEMASFKFRTDAKPIRQLIQSGIIEYAAIEDDVKAYERVMSVQLHLKPPQASSSNTSANAAHSLEADFLKRLTEQQKTIRGTAAQFKSQPTTKVGQLRAEMSKEGVGPGKKPARHLQPVIKLPRMQFDRDATAVSSSESDYTEDMHGLRGEFEATVTVPNTSAPHRTIKVIPIAADSSGAAGAQSRFGASGRRCQTQRDLLMAKGIQRFVLSLDFSEISETSLDGSEGARNIPDAFASFEEYCAVFEPLLRLECRAQLFSAKQEMSETDSRYVGLLTSVALVDEFHELTFLFKDFKQAKEISEYDLLASQSMMVSDKQRIQRQVLAMVCHTTMRERDFEMVVRIVLPVHAGELQAAVRQGCMWEFRSVCSLITNLREYLALQNLPVLGMHRFILDPQRPEAVNRERLDTATLYFKQRLELNESQARAVAASLLSPSPLTLIQGPPGTGKTRTIEGLLGAIFGRPSGDNPVSVRYARIMLCAPSNAAVDEMVRRIKGGVRDCYGQRIPLRIVRIGSSEMIHEEVRDVCVDYLVEKQLQSSIEEAVHLLQAQRDQIRELKAALDASTGDPSRTADLKSQLWRAKEDARKNGRFVEDTKASARQRIMSTAQVVCCTLSGAGHDLLGRMEHEFELVVIDEACQSVEPSALIPLQYGCRRCILVGGMASA